jgi:hypothetical protein
MERLELARRPAPVPMERLELASRPAAVPPRPPRSPWLTRSLARTGARRRLETEVRAIAVDLLGRCQPGELPDDGAAWLATAAEAAVTRVCESSMAALAEALDAELRAAPPAIVRRCCEAEVRHDAGYF